MRFRSLVLVALLAGTLASAQSTFRSAKGCAQNTQDRTIHLCDEDGSALGISPLIRAYAQSSAGVTSFELWMDGVKVRLGAFTPEPGSLFTFLNFAKPGWHRFVFIAKDRIGEFRKTAYYFLTFDLACAPSGDRQIRICNGLKDGDTVTSPVHLNVVTQVSTSSHPMESIGTAVLDADVDVEGRAFVFNQPGSPRPKMSLTGAIHLKPGTHTISIFASDGSDDHWKKTITLNVVQ